MESPKYQSNTAITRHDYPTDQAMRLLFSLLLIFTLSGCVDTTSQTLILERAKAEVASRENWAERAYIRVDNRPENRYLTMRDFSWKVSAAAIDFSDYPKYEGIKTIPGSRRVMRFSRDGCLLKYEDASRTCTVDRYAPTEDAWAGPDK